MDFDQIDGFLVKAIGITVKLVRSGNFKTNAEFGEFLVKNDVSEFNLSDRRSHSLLYIDHFHLFRAKVLLFFLSPLIDH